MYKQYIDGTAWLFDMCLPKWIETKQCGDCRWISKMAFMCGMLSRLPALTQTWMCIIYSWICVDDPLFCQMVWFCYLYTLSSNYTVNQTYFLSSTHQAPNTHTHHTQTHITHKWLLSQFWASLMTLPSKDLFPAQVTDQQHLYETG